MSVGRLLSRHYLSKIGSGRVEINFYLLNPNNNRCWRATPVWIFDWDNIERAHVANQKPELRSPERIVFGQRKKTTAATTTKRRCLGPRAERNPGSCANPFCLWGDFWENVAIESVFLSVYRIPGRRWHFVKKFSDPWPPHPQNLRTVIDKQAYKHGVNFLFFVTHWKGERGATKLTSVTADRVQHLWNLVSDKDQHEKLSNYPITSLLGIVHQS